jgi:hypothetical protein
MAAGYLLFYVLEAAATDSGSQQWKGTKLLKGSWPADISVTKNPYGNYATNQQTCFKLTAYTQRAKL